MRIRHPLLCAALLTVAAGCVEGHGDASAVAAVLPTAKQVEIALPQTAGSAALGETAEWYRATRNVTRTLNGGTAWVLILVHTVVHFPPTSQSGDTYIWGPHSDALDPAEWKLQVTELADGSYDWEFLGRNKAGGTFEVLINGNADRSAAGAGQGQFTVDFDAAERVNPDENDAKGQFTATYDIGAGSLDIDAQTRELRNGTMVDITTRYEYDRATDGSGAMKLALHGDTEDAGTLPEDAELNSRWRADGAGRADVRLRNGDLAAQVTGSECWDTAFLRVYYQDSATLQPTEGDAAACVFQDAVLP